MRCLKKRVSLETRETLPANKALLASRPVRRIYTKKGARFYNSMKQDIRIEYPSVGATYSNNVYGVYEYGVYSGRSVLAGQTCRIWLDEFDTLEEAQSAYPFATFNGVGYRAINLSSIEPDWFDEADAGERWNDDY